MRFAALLVLSLGGGCTPPAAEPVVLCGTVRYLEPLPKPRPIVMEGIPDFPKEGIPRESLVVDEHGGVRWAFVYIRIGAPAQAYDGPPLRMEQSGLRYQPHVVGLRVGQTLEVHNRDNRMHNVHPILFLNREYGRAFMMPKDGPWTSKFETPEVMVRLKCDVHPWMSAWVGVLDHPYCAVTDKEGNFEIRNVPPGNYTLAVWHESLASEEREIRVRDNATVDFTLKKK